MTEIQRRLYRNKLQTMSIEDKTRLFHESEQAAEKSGGEFTTSDYAYAQLFTNQESEFYSE